MIIDISKENITNELLVEGGKCFFTTITPKTMRNSSKYLVLNWDNLSVEQFLEVLPTIDKDHIRNFLFSETVKNKDILFNMFKHIEEPNEEYLWNGVVDARYISNEMYLKNTYEENFDIWFKMNEDRFESLPESNPEYSYASFLKAKEEMGNKSPKQLKEEQRRDRVCQFLDENISLDFSLDIFKDIKDYIGQIAYVEFKFKHAITVPVKPLDFSDLERIPEGKKEKYSNVVKDATAFTSVIKGNSSFSDVNQTELLTYFLFKANLPQHIDKYVKYWVRERLGEINPRKNS